MRWLRDQLDRVLWGHVIAAGGDVLGFALLLAALAMLALWTSSCSAGPQFAGAGAATSPTCTWTFTAGGSTPVEGAPTAPIVQLCHDCTIERVEMSCLFDRTSSTPTTEQTGIRTRDVEVSPRTSVSATGGTP